jgi:hypothetical protein
MFAIACYRTTRVPAALILFLVGLLFAFIRMYVTEVDKNWPQPYVGHGHYPDTVVHPTPEEFGIGFLNAGLGQIPLTCLNSVIALSLLIDDLFPDKHSNNSSIACSIGVMNLIGGWFGSMPVW